MRFLAALLLASAVPLHAATWPCESFGTYRECRIAASGNIRLVNERSERQCFEGISWGTRSAGVVWVDRGCRATFTTTDPDPTLTSPRFKPTTVVCESQDGGRQVCPVESAANGVSLGRQLSTAACTPNRSWGYDIERSMVWVDHGCRAAFVVGVRNAEPPAQQPLDATVVCTSENGRRTVCNADTSAGVQLARQLGDAPCGFNREWGFDAKSIWVTKGCSAEFAVSRPRALVHTVVCEAKSDAVQHCSAETRYGVDLLRPLAGDCTFEKSWGFDASGVWVSNRCSAQFILGGYRLPPDVVPADAARITCESQDAERARCAADTTRGVGLIRQLSNADCVLNRTWGYDASAIWVSSGCRAEFAVAR
ncbi:MAG TPA: DUF3011 domain-containing protein [Thermoanaerobaculia bacterium]|jgi:hypothetical protein